MLTFKTLQVQQIFGQIDKKARLVHGKVTREMGFLIEGNVDLTSHGELLHCIAM